MTTRGQKKAIKRAEALAKYIETKNKIREMGYEVVKATSLSWTFKKNGKQSVLGFDSEAEVVDYVYKYEPEPDKIFPSDKTTSYLKS